MAERQHGTRGRGDRRQELLYDESIPTPTHAERALTMVSQLSTGTLCTLGTKPKGHPYGSFVTFALWKHSPIFLISTLAEHTQNLLSDSRASLLVSEAGEGDPLALGRATMLGDCEKLSGDELIEAKAAYLETHPSAKFYADFTDFSVWKLNVESIRYIGGYGRMSWVESPDWEASNPDPIAPHSAGIIEHMNEDHADALISYCLAFSRADEVSSATMVGIDSYGFEMSADTPDGPKPIRVAFDTPLEKAQDARGALVDLVRKARAQ